MLQEVRKLLFSEDVILRALLDECAAQKVNVPNSPLQGIKIDGYHATNGGDDDASGKGRVVLEFATADPEQPYRVVLNEHFVIGALILACRAHGVPLPRGADKHLQMTDRGLALTVALKMDTGQKPAEAAQSVAQPGAAEEHAH